jgi:hypothetical protein
MAAGPGHLVTHRPPVTDFLPDFRSKGSRAYLREATTEKPQPPGLAQAGVCSSVWLSVRESQSWQ